MNNHSPLSSSSSSAATPMSSTKPTHSHDKNEDNVSDSVITINEKVNLTKQQHHVLKMICDTYQMSFSEYIQQALVEAMRFDIEEGNFSDALLEKVMTRKRIIILLRLLLVLSLLT
jgi:anti-sigma28 factor (negative regulator of flagellin synthesis)